MGLSRLVGLPAGGDDPGLPARSAPAIRRSYGPDVYPTACDNPRDNGVRVPHFPGSELIATPCRSRHPRDGRQHATRAPFVVAQAHRAVHCLSHVRDAAAMPNPDLVAKHAQATCPGVAYGAFRDDSPLVSAQVGNRGLLDDVGLPSNFDLERRVIEIAGRAPLPPRRDYLERAAVVFDRVSAGAQRKPVQVDRGYAGHPLEPLGADDLHALRRIFGDLTSQTMGSTSNPHESNEGKAT